MSLTLSNYSANDYSYQQFTAMPTKNPGTDKFTSILKNTNTPVSLPAANGNYLVIGSLGTTSARYICLDLTALDPYVALAISDISSTGISYNGAPVAFNGTTGNSDLANILFIDPGMWTIKDVTGALYGLAFSIGDSTADISMAVGDDKGILTPHKNIGVVRVIPHIKWWVWLLLVIIILIIVIGIALAIKHRHKIANMYKK